MGCFCEKLPNRGSVRHMEVVFLARGRRSAWPARLDRSNRSPQTGACVSSLRRRKVARNSKSFTQWRGYVPAGMQTWAAPVDSVLTEQFTRLKNFIERGDPAAKPDASKRP